MADVVQFKLERMLDEIDDLERRGLFSRREIAEIVKKRRKFEYRLKRPSPLKADFLAYIDYEKQLEVLRLLRKKALRKSGDKKERKSVSDFAGVSRIIDIYRLATNRFKGDIKLWFQYLEFCRARGHDLQRRRAREYVLPNSSTGCRLLDTHLIEAYLECMELFNFRAFQRNPLLLPWERDLMSLRLLFVTSLLLFLNKYWELLLPLRLFSRNLQDDESEGKVDVFGEQGLNILQTVYSGAIEALSTAFSLRTRFLEILEATQLAHSEDMQKKILNDMKRDFSKEPLYWDWLARVEVGGAKGINPQQLGKAVQVYEEGLKFIPSAAMIELYVKFLMDAITDENREGEAATHFLSHGHAVELASHLQTVFEKAESMGCITEDLACQHVSFLLHRGKLKEAKILTEKLCSEKFPDAVHLWILRLSIEIKCSQNESLSRSKADLQYIFDLLRNILTKVSISEAENLWIMGLKYFATQGRHFDKLVETAFLLLARDGGCDKGFSLSSTIVNVILQRDGVESAREMYKRFLALPRPGLTTYRNCIELELNLASTGDKTGLPNARKLYESALATYDQDASLWQDYYSMEVKMGTSETAAAVHWRARKALKNNIALLSTNS
ncbi:HAT (Half-A-TPR) repeat-containing protein [Handroanthus impetiginosus]|uniref:HAT (Half-A-TPR) repeat-containing protein n=1 Tax=Handroanthus impetiginosus TaxID=429701 RepID=A0A2G9H7Y2_9LAMI|nr:HAT (Half-A-TPR) repeat-containing protein [Handroanthus impetiginosus]